MQDLGRGLRNFWLDPAGRIILGVAGTMIGVGTVFYRLVEHLSWIDSLYFCVITLTTVGFGDISPDTTAARTSPRRARGRRRRRRGWRRGTPLKPVSA